MKPSLGHKLSVWRNNQKLREQATEFVLAAFVVLLPFQWDFPPISLMIMLLGVVFLFFMNKSYLSNLFKNRYFWLIAAYYVWMLFGLTYTDYPKEGGADATVQIALIAWPLGLACLGVVNESMRRRLLLYFTRSTALSSLILLGLAYYKYTQDQSVSHFFYKHLSAWELVPQHYLSMYISFAILIIFHRWYFYAKELNKSLKVELLLYLVLFVVMQVLLSVRIQWIAFPLSLLPILIVAMRFGKMSKRNTWYLGIGLFFAAVAFALLPGTQRRLVETYHEIRSFDRMVEKKQTNHRVYLWKYGTEVIGEHMWTGTGTGGANKALHEKLQDCEAKFWDGEKVYYLRDKEYNVHNVYLQAWMTHGVIGFILVLLILIAPLIRALRQKDVLVAGFLILAIISFSTESMLERQAGVLWFGLFYALLVVSHKSGVTEANTNTP